MVSVSKKETEELQKLLIGTKNKTLQKIAQKLSAKSTPKKYAYTKDNTQKVLNQGYKTKHNVKIKYYSLSSDETRFREISIYYLNKDYIIAYCHLRKEIRTFVTRRIIAATLLDKKYTIPKSFHDKDYVKGVW